MAAGAKRLWSDRVAAVWPGGPPVESPGFPDIHWVCVEPAEGGYREQWTRALAALAARRSTRTFAAYHVSPARRICSVSGRWPAVERLPQGVPHRRGEALSVPAVVKRRDRRQRFPSTASVATGPFRQALAHKVVTDAKVRAAVERLRTAVDFLRPFGIRFGPGGLPGIVVPSAGPGAEEARWLAEAEGVCLLAETWSTRALSLELGVPPADRQGFEVAVAACAARLADLLAVADLDPPATHLAVVVQDADSMGRRLADGADQHDDARGWHGQVSAALVRAAHAQRHCLERGATADDDEPPLGRMVYVGGDDALGFVPARSAFAAATALNAAFRRELVGTAERPGPVPAATASTAVVFCHVSAPLQSVLTAARQLLEETKDAFRPGFGVAVWRRGGERVRAVRPWQVGPSLPLGVGAPEALEILVALMHAGLSGRLVADLERVPRPSRR